MRLRPGSTANDIPIPPRFPVAQLITPDGKALEGYGVIPDITVNLERRQLLAGIDAQLQAAIDYILEAER